MSQVVADGKQLQQLRSDFMLGREQCRIAHVTGDHFNGSHRWRSTFKAVPQRGWSSVMEKLFQKGSRANTQTCAANGCTWATDPKLMMCRSHWLRLPGHLQADVWSAYRAMPSKFPSHQDLMGDTAWTQAAATAVEHTAKVEGRDEANRYRAAATRLIEQLDEQVALAA